MKATYTLMLGEDEVDVEFEINADMTYLPARLSGPPEDCYPDESECVITSIVPLEKIDGCNDADLLDALETQVSEEKIIEDLWEDFELQRSSYEADKADYYRDSREGR